MKTIRYAFAFLPVLLLLANTIPPAGRQANENELSRTNPLSISNEVKSAVATTDQYAIWDLGSSGLSKEAFELGLKGYRFLQQKNALHKTNLLTIIDYSQPSSKKRLYVLNMQTGKIVFNTLVAHGRNSGYNYATSFSNDEESHKSSLGFYITMGTYTGANGYSLKLKGCEKGINDKAIARAIVFHGADYVSRDFLRSKGYLGRSYGCPAVPVALNKKIIDKIKNGSCMFLYYPARTYITRSKILDS